MPGDSPFLHGWPGTSTCVAKPDKSPVRLPAEFHFDDYGVNRDLSRVYCGTHGKKTRIRTLCVFFFAACLPR